MDRRQLSDSSYANLSDLFHRQAERLGNRPALRYKKWGLYTDQSWSSYCRVVERAACGWISLGIERGDRIALLSENRAEWLAADLSILSAGAADVSLHAPLTASQIAYQLADSGARWVVVSTPEQLAKVIEAQKQLPKLEGIVSFDARSCSCPIPFMTWAALMTRGHQTAATHRLRELQNQLGPDDLAALMYTSGTTGEPKGVMLTHGNLLSNAIATYRALPPEPSDVLLSWLPYSHIYARLVDHYLSILAGCVIALAEGFESIVRNLAEVNPTHMTGVPRFYEKVWENMERVPEPDRAKRLQGLFGTRLKWLSAGGAPLPVHVAQGFCDSGVPLLQGYGLTESSPVISFNTRDHNRIGTVGRAIPGVEIRIGDDGEVLSRGPHIMRGYWNKPEATSEAVDSDGWLHTGDLGSIDDDGYLSITGRKKDLIVLSSGKKIVPAWIESLLVADEYIDQAVVHGDRQRFLSALVVPNFARLSDAARQWGLEGRNSTELVQDPRVYEFMEGRVRERLASVSPQERVKRFLLLDRPFTLADDELTATLKVRRQAVISRHREQLDALYRDTATEETSP